MPNQDLDKEVDKKKIRKVLMTDFYKQDWIHAGEKTVDKLYEIIHSSNKRARIDEAKRLLDYSLNYTDGVVGIRELEEHIQDLEASLKGEDE